MKRIETVFARWNTNRKVWETDCFPSYPDYAKIVGMHCDLLIWEETAAIEFMAKHGFMYCGSLHNKLVFQRSTEQEP